MKKMSSWKESGMDFSFVTRISAKQTYVQAIKQEEYEDEANLTLYPLARVRLEEGEFFVESLKEQIPIPKIEIEESQMQLQKDACNFKIINLAISFILFILTLFFDFTHANLFSSAAWYFSFVGLCSTEFYYFLQRLFGNKDILKNNRMHAAQHAVFNAFFDLNRVPTLEEIKNYSCYSKDCACVQSIRSNWIFIFLSYVLLFFTDPFIFVSAIIVGISFTLWARKNNFYFLQFFHIAKPTDLEYEASIAVLKEALKNKEFVDEKISSGDYETQTADGFRIICLSDDEKENP